MAAAVYNIEVEQGATYSRVITVKSSAGTAINLTGCSAQAMIRKKYSDVSATATFTCTFAADRSTGQLTISLTPVQTSAITCGERKTDGASQYVWDLEITWSTGDVDRLLQGTCQVSPQATK